MVWVVPAGPVLLALVGPAVNDADDPRCSGPICAVVVWSVGPLVLAVSGPGADDTAGC